MYLKKRLETIFHRTIRKTGYDLVKCKYSRHELEIEELLKYYGVSSVLDVGANVGQYAKFIRIGGYKNQIISFEPLTHAFEQLSKQFSNDHNWVGNNYALGDFDGSSEINVSSNSVSSSILGIKESHVKEAPDSAYSGKQKVEVHTLDAIYNSLPIKGNNIYLKIDTQGFEKNVLVGAKQSLQKINTLQIEMSVQPLYEGEDLYFQIADYLYGEGFRLIKIVRGYTKANGELLQFDGVFRRD